MTEEQILTQEDNTHIAELLSGKRPEGMSYEEFKIKRRALGKFLKQRSRGKYIHVSKEIRTEVINGKKQRVVETFKPYVKEKSNV